jgi:hypothetical protein
LLALFVILFALVAVFLLAVALWGVAPRVNRKRWDEARPGSIWFHDSQGNIIPEDEQLKRPRNEGDLL